MVAQAEVKAAKQAYGFLVWNALVMAGLVALVELRFHQVWLFGELKDPLADVMPLIVPWAGALGGATVSLYGCAKHSRDWDDTWNVWHFARPLLGAASGSAAFFIVFIVLKTAGGLKDGATKVEITPVSLGLFFTIAFVCGFKDKYFLELVGKVAEVIFSTGDAKDEEEVAFTLSSDSVDFGDVPVGQSSSHTVRLDLTSGRNVSLDTGWVTVQQVGDDSDGVKWFSPKTVSVVALGATGRDIEVVFEPKEARETKAELVTVLAGVTKKVALQGKGTQ